jgi:hypothetical protein
MTDEPDPRRNSTRPAWETGRGRSSSVVRELLSTAGVSEMSPAAMPGATGTPGAGRRAHGEQQRPFQTEQLKESLRKLLARLLDRGFGIALDKVEQLARTFDDIAARGGYKIGALFGGARAAMSGRNPIWGAITGAVAALSPAAQAAIIIALVLALLLLPVTVVLVLLFLIIVAIVAVVRARSVN